MSPLRSPSERLAWRVDEREAPFKLLLISISGKNLLFRVAPIFFPFPTLVPRERIEGIARNYDLYSYVEMLNHAINPLNLRGRRITIWFVVRLKCQLCCSIAYYPIRKYWIEQKLSCRGWDLAGQVSKLQIKVA